MTVTLPTGEITTLTATTASPNAVIAQLEDCVDAGAVEYAIVGVQRRFLKTTLEIEINVFAGWDLTLSV